MTSTKRHHRTCRHQKYRLTCKQYDRLWEQRYGTCHLCGQPDQDQQYRGLVIDHDATLGYWAVRGLLCVGCNIRLGKGGISGPKLDAYLRNAWFKSLPYAHLITPEPPGERPTVNTESALDRVTFAAIAFRDERVTLPRDHLKIQTARLALVDAAKLAYRLGVRQIDIASATHGVWKSGEVRIAVRERRQQPTIPTTWSRGGLALPCS